MGDYPIIFSAPMIRALLDGRKTMTRRLAGAYRPVYKGADDLIWKPSPWHAVHMGFNCRPVDGYPDYLAGRDGVIYSLKRGTPSPLKATPTSRGYPAVSLCSPDGIKTKHVHALVAAAWLGPRPSSDHEVRHLNSKRDDCRLENLDWATRIENWGDRSALENGIHEDHHAAKITMEKANEIRKSFLSQRQIASQYGLAQSTVCAIKNNQIWVASPPATGRNFALPNAPRLWVRETFCYGPVDDDPIYYRATDKVQGVVDGDGFSITTKSGREKSPWRSPIHMPRWASRLTLTVTATKIERLHEISEADARAEGMVAPILPHWRAAPLGSAFRGIWRDLHGDISWDANPQIVALTFTVVRRNIDAMNG